MLACIIPSDDAPGAREAGVIHYIDRQLTRKFREHRKTYRDGLAEMGGFADVEQDKARKPFFDLVVRRLRRHVLRPAAEKVGIEGLTLTTMNVYTRGSD